MSSRALRRLREEKEAAALLATTNEGDEDESSSEEEEDTVGGGGFMMMLDDESDSESESDDDDDDDKKETTIDTITITNATPNNKSKKASPKKKAAEKKDEEEEEDLDAILSDMNIIQQGTTTDTDHHAIDSAAVGNSNSACIQKHLKSNTIRQLLLSSSTTTNNKNEDGYHYDIQDLDLDYAMRSLVGGGANIGGDPFAMDDLHAQQQQQQQQRGRRGGHRGGGRGGRTKRLVKKYLFGKPRDEWGKPPSYVGGGLGMKELTANVLEEERHSWSIPWPYNNLCINDTAAEKEEGENESSDIDDKLDNDDKDHNNKDGKNNKQEVPTLPSTTLSNNQKWYTLQMSDTYQETNYQYQEMLSTTGGGGGEQGMHDPNALAMFVADHPYFAETLLQLAMVLYYINDRGKGNDLLRRCMFIYESALPMNVLPSSSATSGNNDNDNGKTTTDNNNNSSEILIDIDRPPNSGLFATLFRIMQTSGMSGCYASALATGRYLLSLDPLRDPMGVLLILDYYALAARRISSMSFIVTLVQSNFITIHYKDPLTDRHHKCNLIDMPNWAFSYALALYRLAQQQQNENEDEDSGDESSSPSEQYQERAEEALVHALRTFPMVLPKLLAMNNVNVEDRGMIMDWPSILPLYIADANGTNSIATNDTVEDRVTRASGEHLVRIFVQRCHKLWKEDDLVKWMFHCAQRVIMEHQEQEQEGKSSTPSTTTDTPSTPMTSTFSPALARYAQCDPSEYEDSFRTFPPEAIALDPNIVAPAMALGPNGRRRFLRQRGQQQQQQQLQREAGQGQDPLEIIRRLLGLGNDDGGLGDVEVLDPDSPLLQLYLQSLLPWAQVEGVRPPPR